MARQLGSIMTGQAWPPVLLAKETAATDVISGGRLTLGLDGPESPVNYQHAVNQRTMTIDGGGCESLRSKHSVITSSG